MTTLSLKEKANFYIKMTNNEKGYLPGLDPDTNVYEFDDFTTETFDWFYRNIASIPLMEKQPIWLKKYKMFYLFKELKEREYKK